MSLTSCLKKAGDAIHADDKSAILAAARKYRKDGLSAEEAGRKAVADQIAAVQAMIAAKPAAKVDAKPERAQPAPEPEQAPAPAVAEQPEVEAAAPAPAAPEPVATEAPRAKPAPKPEQPPAKPAPKSFRKSVKVKTAVFMEETGTFAQQEIDADTAIKALDDDLAELAAFRKCIAGG